MNFLLLSIGCGVGSALGVGAGYQLFASGTSDVLGLKTLRHGTGPISYIGIQILGTRPDFAGKLFGEANLTQPKGYRPDESRQRFYVWDDDFNEKGRVSSHKVIRFIFNCKYFHPLVKRIAPKVYCAISGASTLNIEAAPKVVRGILQTVGGCMGLMVPTLSLHVTPEDFESNFTVDPGLVPVARYTEDPLSRLKYIGLSGTLCQGVNTKVFQRIKNNPMRFIKGLAKYLILTTLAIGIAAQLFVLLHTTGLINVCPILTSAGVFTHVVLPITIGGGLVFSIGCYLIT